MIPYDDLVAALATWRARQGLSVAQPAGAAPAPTAKGAPAPAGKTPPARAPSSPQPVVRAPAPAPPRPATSPRPAVAAPPALSGHNDFDDSEGAAVDGDSYDNPGDDFVMSIADDAVETGEATAIGGAPESPADGPKRGKRNPDW
jgi:hypothetical protein